MTISHLHSDTDPQIKSRRLNHAQCKLLLGVLDDRHFEYKVTILSGGHRLVFEAERIIPQEDLQA